MFVTANVLDNDSDPDGDTCWHPAEDNLLGTGKIVMLSRSIHLLRLAISLTVKVSLL